MKEKGGERRCQVALNCILAIIRLAVVCVIREKNARTSYFQSALLLCFCFVVSCPCCKKKKKKCRKKTP